MPKLLACPQARNFSKERKLSSRDDYCGVLGCPTPRNVLPLLPDTNLYEKLPALPIIIIILFYVK